MKRAMRDIEDVSRAAIAGGPLDGAVFVAPSGSRSGIENQGQDRPYRPRKPNPANDLVARPRGLALRREACRDLERIMLVIFPGQLHPARGLAFLRGVASTLTPWG